MKEFAVALFYYILYLWESYFVVIKKGIIKV